MKRLWILITATAVVLIAVGGWAVYGYLGVVDIGERTVSIVIGEGDSFVQVADKLLSERVVRNGTILELSARLRNIDRKLTPGRYEFTGAGSCKTILDRLESADFLRVRVTIPEGASIWRVASILQARLDLDSAAVCKLNTDSAFLALVDLPCLEGYLFPQTYDFKWGVTDTTAVQAMIGMFRRQTEPLWSGDLPLGFSRHDVVKLASIVEAEVFLDEERPLVASVYLNRLRDKLRLDAEPTVIYGLGGMGKLGRPLTRADIRRDTPYNTYRRKGLPPTPINSPGLKSIEAVLNPAETDYFFFVANGTGGHSFSRTNNEHVNTIRRLRSGRR